ncbi:AraC family transcriptional regulator [Actinomadura sp. K4S16]|uniref:helix-turn-helix domain-containing protein n=1 Tax=Actinomadura sp. K4S16 TaxID=1316147 RepID=UPI0011EF0343|nr:AraC family transcriptional regulator [Actinomadura sp. K4S16]
MSISKDDSTPTVRGPEAVGTGTGRVGDYMGYKERLADAVCRPEFPSSAVVMVISFEDPLQLVRSVDGTAEGAYPCLVAALHDSVLVTEHRGLQHGMAIRVSPLRAYSLLGQPMHTLSNEFVDMGVLLGAASAHLAERLAGAYSWTQRFDVLNNALAALLAAGPVPDRAVRWAWQRLKASAGAVPIAGLAEEVGWSRRNLERKFLQQVGLPPKTVARIFRFERAVGLLSEADRSLAEIAARARYSDQSHFSREVFAFTQRTPTELARHIRAAAHPTMADCPSPRL